jgi:manganese/zinc/iron transport system substrate-binding protein
VADLVRIIGGDEVALEWLMGPGIDPHLYKPSAGDVRRMADAQVVFYNGLHLEGKMAEVLEQMGRRGMPTLAVAECIPEEELITSPGFSGVHDPHVWFDVRLWMRAAECVRDGLSDLTPDHTDLFARRTVGYLGELEALDRWVRDRIADVPEARRVLVTAHDAFSYFGRAYGVEVRGLLGVSTAAEAGTADVQELAAFIAERQIPAIFVETSVPPRYVEALQQAVVARGFGVVIGGSLYSDALGDPGGPAATYVGTVQENVDTIVTALSGSEED